MALYVNTNISSINAQRKLSNATNNLNTSYQRLSSGLRINSARDDAAGLQITDRLTAQINGLNQGNRNTNDGIALCQTVEGALDEVTNMLQRIRTLSVQSANGTNTDDDRQAIQEEVTQLSHEIFRIAQKTTFAGAQVLDGNPGTAPLQPNLIQPDDMINFQVGANHNDTIGVNLGTAFKLSTMFDGAGIDVVCVPPRGVEWDKVNDATNTNFVHGLQKKDIENLTTDYNDAPSDAEKFQFLWELSNKYSAKETGATNDQRIHFSGLIATATFNTEFDPTVDTKKEIASKPQNARWTVSTAENAQATLASIDKIIGFVDSKRAELGAIQNRMEATIRNQANISENEADARSRIRDTDFAEETAKMTQLNIIQNASQTILAQANQRPQIALQLLGQ